MTNLIEFLKAFFLGVVEGITEWLPISSTGHMIILNELIQLDVSPEFMEMFLVVVQLGAIAAVVVLFWSKLFPFHFQDGLHVKKPVISMWLKVAVATLPLLIAFPLEDWFHERFYNYQSVAVMLILFGIIFLVVETLNKNRTPRVTSIATLSYPTALAIGFFQLIAALFPGTSRSGATIVGALLLGVSRVTAAEFTFFLAIPAMLGASVLKLAKFGFQFSSYEIIILVIGMVTAFLTSVLVIKLLMSYIKKHDFKVFGWYRIILGCAVLLFFLLR